MLIKADEEDHAPVATDSGLFLATTLAAAVEGEDVGESWFVGTIVQLGPKVNKLNHRGTLIRWILEMESEGHDIAVVELAQLRRRIEDLPEETPEPLRIGDRVCFSWASGQQITVDGDVHLILRASDVLAVLEE